jgi:hypothetical protein
LRQGALIASAGEVARLRGASLEEQLAAVRAAARAAGVDLSRQEREMQGRIEAMRRKVQRRSA